jgi:hypothetical protein
MFGKLDPFIAGIYSTTRIEPARRINNVKEPDSSPRLQTIVLVSTIIFESPI